MARISLLLAATGFSAQAIAQNGAQLAFLPVEAPGSIQAMDSCRQVAECFHHYPWKPGKTRPIQGDHQPDRIMPGFVVPLHPIGPGDANCPSGDCFAIDPEDVCEAYSPNCVPGQNIRWPPLPCDPRHPKCPRNGFLLDPHIPCHPASGICPPGGVKVTPQRCTPGGRCPCGCGWYLPPWINGCADGSPSCSNGFNVTNPTIWPQPFPPEQGHIPGYPWDPRKTCNPNLNPNCDSGDIVVPKEPACDARLPGCIPQTSIPQAVPCECPKEPACPGGQGNCFLVKPRPCHPNDPAPEPGCIMVDPIPCTKGTPGCPGAVHYPPVVTPCHPGTLGCNGNGYPPIMPPTIAPDSPVIPSENPSLEVDPDGPVRCRFVHGTNAGLAHAQECPKPVELKPEYYGNSKFPCTHDDKKPCLGESVHSWVYWKSNAKSDNYAWESVLNFEEDVIMTVANFAELNKIWEVFLDDKSIGETVLGQFVDTTQTCSGPEDCIAKGSPHGYFVVPKGYHDLRVTLKQGLTGHTWEWVRGTYKIHKFCTCLPDSSSKPAVSSNPPYIEPVPLPGTVTLPPPPAEPTPLPPSPPPSSEPAPPAAPPASEPAPPADPPASESTASPAPPSSEPPPSPSPETPSSTPSPSPPAPAEPPAPSSKFPCSKSDDEPCLGNVVRVWKRDNFAWRAPQYPNTGSDPPAPITQTINFPQDTILTVTDVWNKVEHFTLHLDGNFLGNTSMITFDRSQSCGFYPDDCIKKGWSHGYFFIPAGQHELKMEWTRGVGDFRWWLTAVIMTRFNALCSC